MALSTFSPLIPSLGGTSQDKLKSQDNRIGRLNQEAEGLRHRINQVEESKAALSNNRQLRESQDKYETHIQMLENDKVSLMKRLNMVLSELEKATHEKSEISAKLLEQERGADELKKKLDEVSSLKNVVNRNLQEDLRYERDLNDKLREELNKFEREKEQLMGKLKEQEQITQEISRETNALNQNLNRKNEDLRRLEREHESNLARLKDLNEQLDNLRVQELNTKNDKRRMENELEDLTRERNDLIRRMNELSDKYEDYVATMNRERLEIMKANKNHVKLLTAKLFFQMFQEMVQSRRNQAIQQMKGTVNHIQDMENKMLNFTRVMTNYGVDRKRHFLRLWYRNAMNFVHENYKKLNLVEFNVNKKRKIKFYYKWRDAFFHNRKCFDSKVDSLKILRILMGNKQDLQLRSYLCKWRDFVELRQTQQDFMYSIMMRKKLRLTRGGFVSWLGHTKKKGLEDRYDKMSELVTNLWFKQRVFLGLKQACLESKTENALNKFKAWKDWCEKSRKNKYFEKKSVLVERIHGTKTERLLKKCFDAIKFCNIQYRYEETKAELDKEIPIREELEKKRDTLLKVNTSKDKYNLFRQLCIRCADLKYRSLAIWKDYNVYYKRTMNRVKLRLIETHKRNLSSMFYKWKESIDKKQMIQLISQTEDLMNENQELTNTLQACKQEREKLIDCSSKQKGLKIERIRNMLNRNLIRRKFAMWANSAQYIQNIEESVFLTSKTIRRRRLRNAFNKYLKKVKEVQRQEYVHGKELWFTNVRKSKTLQTCVKSWKKYVKRWRASRTFLSRSIRGVDKAIENDAFTLWKNLVYKDRKQKFLDNITELEKRQQEHEKQITFLKKEIENNYAIQRHLNSKMQSQSHKIMANFISRYIHSSQAKGFYTWLDNMREAQNQQRFLKSTMLFWMKNQVGKGFRRWVEQTFKHKENELQQTFLARETQRKQLALQKDEEEKQQNEQVQDLKIQLEEAIKLRNKLENGFQKALDTHISRMKKNTYIDKRKNIFLCWIDHVRKEKNAINVIGALTRKNLRMEVWSRIRRTARENYLDRKALKVCNAFFNMLKSHLVLHAFGKWRRKNYTHLVKTMIKKTEELEEAKVNRENEIKNMETLKQQKAEKILKQKRQREIVTKMIAMTQVLSKLNQKKNVLQQNIEYFRAKKATQKWSKRTKLTLMLRKKDQLVIQKWNDKIMKFSFHGWQRRLKIERLLCNRIFKFVKRMSYLDIASGFQQINHFKESIEERVRERKDHGGATIYKTINRIMKHKYAETFQSLKNRAFKKDFKEKFLLRAFRHTILYRMRHFFGKWKHNKERMDLAENVNCEGDVVVERNEMKRKVEALKCQLMKNGYKKEDIDRYLQEKGDKQKQLMHKAVVSLFFKNSEFKIMPKAMNQWKRWVYCRKLMKRYAAFTLNCMNNPLMWYFQRWKYEEQNERRKLKNVTKSELIDKIVQDEMAIGSSQAKIQRMDEAIDHLNIQRENLLQHYITGQKLAISLGKNNHLKAMFRAFARWKRDTKIAESIRLGEQLDRTGKMIGDLMQHLNKLENISKALHDENEELRQAAMDGIEIAKAVQELTKEREQLSADLQDRSSTIKKLIEDNNNLSLRLCIAQKEAEQLEQLNQQSYMAPPEREQY